MKSTPLLSLGLTAILFLAIGLSLAEASNVEIIQVGPLTEKMVTFNLSSGQEFTGSLAISGGGNDIDFWVTDPQGAKILDFGRVYQGRTFEFTAQASGAYALHLSNAFSWFTGKVVNLTYDVGLPTIGGMDFGTLLIIIGVVVILLVIIVALAIALNRRKRMSKTNQPSPPSNPPRVTS